MFTPSPPPACISLSHSLSLSSAIALQIRSASSLPEEWKYLQGHCKHSKQGTTPLSCPWLSAGTDILSCTLVFRKDKAISVQNGKHIWCSCFHVTILWSRWPIMPFCKVIQVKPIFRKTKLLDRSAAFQSTKAMRRVKRCWCVLWMIFFFFTFWL